MSRGPLSRDALWRREALNAYLEGRGKFPVCPHCDLPVTTGQAWERCHVGTARWAGGRHLKVGHRLCNQQHNHRVDTPSAAKSARVRARHRGIAGPGLGKRPMWAGKRSKVSKSFNHGLVPRLTHAQKHARYLASRAITPEATP